MPWLAPSKWALYPGVVMSAACVLVLLAPLSNRFIAGAQDEATVYSEIHCKHFFYGLPQGTGPTNDLIIRDIYALSANDETKFADWVAFMLDRETSTGTNPGTRNWQPDPWLDERERFEELDFEQAHARFSYDMGHLAPLDAFIGDKDWADSNILSNITPQHSNLNRGKWKSIEGACTAAARDGLTIYVYTGPLYEHDMPPLDNSDDSNTNSVKPHVVPSGFWKVIFYQTLEAENSIYSASFMFENAPVTDTALDHLVTVDDVEAATGLDLMPALQADKQEEFEARLYEDFADALLDRDLDVSNALRVPEL